MKIVEIPKPFNKKEIKYINVGLKDKMVFGEYFGFTIEEIIEKDFSIIDYFIKNSPYITFTKEVENIIKDIIKNKRSVYNKKFTKDSPL